MLNIIGYRTGFLATMARPLQMIRCSASKPDKMLMALTWPRHPRGLIARRQLGCCAPKSREQSENVYENKGPLRKTRDLECRREAAAFLPNVPNPVRHDSNAAATLPRSKNRGNKARMSMKRKGRSARLATWSAVAEAPPSFPTFQILSRRDSKVAATLQHSKNRRTNRECCENEGGTYEYWTYFDRHSAFGTRSRVLSVAKPAGLFQAPREEVGDLP